MFISIGMTLLSVFGKGFSEKTAKIVGMVALVILLVILLSVGKCAYDNSVIEEHEAEREAKAAPAREKAADQRVKDTIRNIQNEEDLHAVIEAAPGGELSPAARALACERLRKLGRIPPACRPASSDGSEADPR